MPEPDPLPDPPLLPWSEMPAGAVWAVLGGRTLVVLAVPLLVVVHSAGQEAPALLAAVGCLLTWLGVGDLRVRRQRSLLSLGVPLLVVAFLLGPGRTDGPGGLAVTAVLGLLGGGVLLGRWSAGTTWWLRSGGSGP